MPTDGKAIAKAFFKAWTTKDFDKARSLLHDDVSFAGPIDSFNDADTYIGALQGLSQIVTGAEEEKVFADGNDVCVIYTLETKVTTSPTAEWYHLRNGKISAVRVFFDARPFAGMSS